MPENVGAEDPLRRTNLIAANLGWAFNFGRGAYAAADALADDIVKDGAPIWRFQGLVMKAYNAYFKGEVAAAARYLEAAEECYPEGLDADLLSLPTYPVTGFHVIRSHVGWCRGDALAANEDAQRAMVISASLPAAGGDGLPTVFRGVFRDFNLAGVHAFNAWLRCLQEDFSAAEVEADKERAVVARHAAEAGVETFFATYNEIAALYDSFAASMAPGHREVRPETATFETRLRAYQALGSAGIAHLFWCLGVLHLAEGSREQALLAAEQGLQHANSCGELLFESDLIALRARAQFAADPAVAVAAFGDALGRATDRGSPPLRLRAARAWAATDPSTGRTPLLAVIAECGARVSPLERRAAEMVAGGSPAPA
jgi:hypothetical protein